MAATKPRIAKLGIKALAPPTLAPVGDTVALLGALEGAVELALAGALEGVAEEGALEGAPEGPVQVTVGVPAKGCRLKNSELYAAAVSAAWSATESGLVREPQLVAD